jgi:hypothetical protein
MGGVEIFFSTSPTMSLGTTPSMKFAAASLFSDNSVKREI